MDRPLELPFLSQEVSQDEVDLRGLGVLAGGLGELHHGAIDLTGGEEVETEDVVDRGRAPCIGLRPPGASDRRP